MSESGWVFSRLSAQARKVGYETVTLTLRHHYGKVDERELGRTSIRDYVRDVAKVIRTIGPCVLVGHSMGGLIAQAVAAECTEVKKAVFVTSALPLGVPVLSWRLLRLALTLLKPRYLWQALAGRGFQLSAGDLVALVGQGINGQDMQEYIEHYLLESAKVAQEIVFGISVGKIECPTLLVSGSEDRLTPYFGTRIARRHGSDELIYAGLGHLVLLSHKANGGILSWLQNSQ